MEKLCLKIGALAVLASLVACGSDDGDVKTDLEDASNVRIAEVDAINDQVTLRNFGDEPADISDYFFCRERNYISFAESTNNGSDFTLDPDEEITFDLTINDEASDVAIYNVSGAFSSPEALVDFMQFGASFSGSAGREDVATVKGI